MIESKAADVFAFAMLAVEVFTGKIPFEGQKHEVVVLRFSRGGRPEMPGNAQLVGLTCAMWRLLESCWQQDPNKRPAMGEVVRRWQKFVESNRDDGNVVTECVQITPVIQSPLLFRSQLFMIDLGNHSLRHAPRRRLVDLRQRLRLSNS